MGDDEDDGGGHGHGHTAAAAADHAAAQDPEEDEEEESFHSRSSNSYETGNGSASSTSSDDGENDLAKRSPPKHIIRSPQQDKQRQLEQQHENALSKILMDKLSITKQRGPPLPLEPPLDLEENDDKGQDQISASPAPVYHQVNGEMVLVKSPKENSKNSKVTIKNKHWKFVKTTFRQLHLAKALVPKTARTTPISSPRSSPKNSSKHRKQHQPQHVKLSDEETKQQQEEEDTKKHIGELKMKPKTSNDTSSKNSNGKGGALLTDIQLSMLGSSDDENDEYDEGYNDDERNHNHNHNSKSNSKSKVRVFEGNVSSDDDDDNFQRQLIKKSSPSSGDNGTSSKNQQHRHDTAGKNNSHHPPQSPPTNNHNSLLRSSPGNSIRKKLRSMVVGFGGHGNSSGGGAAQEALPLDEAGQQESPRTTARKRRLGVGLGVGKKKKDDADAAIAVKDYKSVSSGSGEFPTSSFMESAPDSTTRYDGDRENNNNDGSAAVSDSDSDSFFDSLRGDGENVDQNNHNNNDDRFLQGSGSINVSIATFPSSVGGSERSQKDRNEDGQEEEEEEDDDRRGEDGQKKKTLNGHHHHHDTAMEESAHVSVVTLDSYYRYARKLLDSSQRKELDLVHQRRKELLEQTTNAEEYICKALGMTRSNGMCTRHINQPIVMTLGGGAPANHKTGGNNYDTEDNDMPSSTSTAVLLCDHAPVWTCRICRSEQQSTTTTRVAPSRTQSSDSMSSLAMVGHQSMQNLGQVVMQLQKLQTDRDEWDKRTKLLGESTHINHSHHSEGLDSMSSLGLTDLGSNGNSFANLEGNHSTRSRRTGADKSSRDNLKASLSSLLSAATAVLSDEEWATQLKRRIVQVRSWDDRFALQHHPHFSPYFKMLSYGIPLEAVKHSVYMDGYDPDVMDLNEKQSLESQIHLLPAEVVDNLRAMSAIDIPPPRSSDGKTGSYGAIPVKELSVSEAVQHVIDSFQERRRNQVFVASALLKEANLMKLVEPRPPTVVNALDESHRSILSFEGEDVGNGDDQPAVYDKNENDNAGGTMEMMDESVTIEYPSAITKNYKDKEDPGHRSNVPQSDEDFCNSQVDKTGLDGTKQSKSDMNNLLASDGISPKRRENDSNPEIPHEKLAQSSVPQSIEAPSMGSNRKSLATQKRRTLLSQNDIPLPPAPESDSLHSGSPKRRRGSELLLDAAKDSSHFERSILMELVDVLESPSGKSPAQSEHSKLVTTPNSGSNRMEYRKRRSLTRTVEESPIVNIPILESPTKSDSLVDSDVSEQNPPLREVVFDDSRDLDADTTNGTDEDFLSTHKKRLSAEELASGSKSHIVSTKKEGKTDKVPVDLVMLDELKKLRGELAQRDNVEKSMRDEIASLRKELASKDREYTAAETQVSDLYSALAQQGQQYLEKGKELDRVQKLLQEQEQNNAATETKLTALRQEMEQKAAAELTRSKQFDQLRLVLKQRVDAESNLQKELQVSQFETERLELAVDQAEGEMGRLRKDLEQHTKAENDLKLAVTARESEVESLRKELLDTRSKVERNDKDDASRLNADVEEKNKIIDDLRRQLKNRDGKIGQLQQKMRKEGVKSIQRNDRKSTPSNNSSTVQGQVASSMKEKIDQEKERQAALRKKILSPHRVQPKKKSVSKDTPEDARAFQALALSPAGKSRNRIEAQKSNRSKKRNPAAAMPSRPALSPEKSPSGRSSVQRSKMNKTPTRSPTTPQRTKGEVKRDNESKLDQEDATNNNPVSQGKKSEEEIAKELILNLFDSSISSNQIQYKGGEGDGDGTKTPPAVKSPQRRPVSARTPYSSDRKPVATLTPQSRKVLMSSTTTATTTNDAAPAPAADSSIQR